MTLHHDLFPETLVVTMVDGRPMTSSLEVAEYFGKEHHNVLRAIKAQISEAEEDGDFEFSLLNFEERSASYLVKGKRRERPIYYLTKNGFNLTVMGFTGKEAGRWKRAFIRAFDALETELRAKEARYAQALDRVRPNLRPVVEGTEQGQKRADIAGPLGKSVHSVTYHRRQARKLGLLPGEPPSHDAA